MKETNKKKLRVLVIISAPAMGGIEKQLLSFLQRYDRERFSVDVACCRSTEGSLRDEFLATATNLIFCRWSTYVIPFVWRLLRLLRLEKYDVVHARMSEAGGAAILASVLAGVPIRITSYEHTKTHWQKPGLVNRCAVSVLQWMTRRWATKIVGDAEVCLDVYYPDWRQHPELFRICYDGIDIERFCGKVTPNEVRSEFGIPADSLVVGHIGGFRKPKNHQTIVDIAGHVSKHFENAFFLLVGDGQLRQQIEAEVQRRGLSGRFVFAGNRNDAPRMLSAMDVFVMPSLDEGFGLAVAEAQLRGLPVVASDIPGIREALCPAMHKFCRRPLDFAGMAEQVTSLLKDPRLRSELGSEGRKYVADKFSIDKTVKQLESIYDSATVTARQ